MQTAHERANAQAHEGNIKVERLSSRPAFLLPVGVPGKLFRRL